MKKTQSQVTTGQRARLASRPRAAEQQDEQFTLDQLPVDQKKGASK